MGAELDIVGWSLCLVESLFVWIRSVVFLLLLLEGVVDYFVGLVVVDASDKLLRPLRLWYI